MMKNSVPRILQSLNRAMEGRLFLATAGDDLEEAERFAILQLELAEPPLDVRRRADLDEVRLFVEQEVDHS